MAGADLAPLADRQASGPFTRATTPEPCIRRLRLAVVERRAATWRHQGRLGLPQARTARRARTARSCAYLRWVKRLWAVRADKAWSQWARLQVDVVYAIHFVFGPEYDDGAISVSWCEGRHNTRAHNGQYLGTFQMGDFARGTYGHGDTAIEQVQAAHRYFVASGRDWSPWSCKPDGSVAY